jgi:membrane-associated protein
VTPLLAVVEELVRWIGPVFATAGYAIVGVAVLLERSLLIGLAIPGDVILAMGGIYAARGDLSVTWVVALGTVAAICGESAGYWLGRRYGRALIRKMPLVRRMERRLNAAEGYFQEHGGKTVAIGRFATAAGALVPFAAGVGRMPYGTFLAFDVPAVVVWAAGITAVGYLFGNNLEHVDSLLSRFGWVMLGLLVVLIGFLVWRRQRRTTEAARETQRR